MSRDLECITIHRPSSILLPSFEATVTDEKFFASFPSKNENLIPMFIHIYIYIYIYILYRQLPDFLYLTYSKVFVCYVKLKFLHVHATKAYGGVEL